MILTFGVLNVINPNYGIGPQWYQFFPTYFSFSAAEDLTDAMASSEKHVTMIWPKTQNLLSIEIGIFMGSDTYKGQTIYIWIFPNPV